MCNVFGSWILKRTLNLQCSVVYVCFWQCQKRKAIDAVPQIRGLILHVLVGCN